MKVNVESRREANFRLDCGMTLGKSQGMQKKKKGLLSEEQCIGEQKKRLSPCLPFQHRLKTSALLPSIFMLDFILMWGCSGLIHGKQELSDIIEQRRKY